MLTHGHIDHTGYPPRLVKDGFRGTCTRMVNGYRETLDFTVPDGAVGEWQRVVEIGRESPEDIREPGQEMAVTSASYSVGPGRWSCWSGRARGAS